jgi:aldose 1-epimerase
MASGAATIEHSVVAGHPAVVLRAGDTSATFVPELGMLGTSLRHRDGEYLDLHGGPSRVRAGHTTGLPLLAPWANRIRGDYRVGPRRVDVSAAPELHYDGNGLPIHGTMLGRDGWEVERTGVSSSGAARLVARFDATGVDAVMASFPFPHSLTITVAVRPGRLEVATALTATGRTRVPVSFGWHPYFRLPDEELDDLRLLLPAWQHMDLDDRMLPTGIEHREAAERRELPAEGLDDAYRLLARGRSLRLAGRRRALTMTPGAGYHFAQVYASGGSPVVALEPMVAAIDALGAGTAPLVDPGDTYTARFRIDLR